MSDVEITKAREIARQYEAEVRRLEAEVEQLRADLFAARQAVLSEGLEVERLATDADEAYQKLLRDLKTKQAEVERLRAALEEISDYRKKSNDLYELGRLRELARAALAKEEA